MESTRTETDVLTRLEGAWRVTDALFERVGDRWLDRPIPLRHPFQFYLGHLPAFAWNQVARGLLGRPSFEPHFDDLYERGIDPLDAAEAKRVAIHDWPSVEATLAYRDRVRDELRGLVEAVRSRAADDVLADGLRIYHVVLEHELMHHETLFYMLHEAGPEGRSDPPGSVPEPVLGGEAPAREGVDVPGGRVTLGASFEELPFGWDNEFPRCEVEVEGFTLDRTPITVAEFREFVDAGGYGDERWWGADDWAWLRAQGKTAPHAWQRDGDGWLHRTYSGPVPLDAVGAWPALVAGAEAQAWCRWKGVRLPTEPELRRAAYGTPGSDERRYPWGDEPPTPERGNFGFDRFDPLPVGSRPEGRSAFGVDELVGNGWEWTSTDFGPLPGFEPWIRTYPGYSADFFTGLHAVVFGAAHCTPAQLLRPSFRNWFQRRYVYVPATFRCVRSG